MGRREEDPREPGGEIVSLTKALAWPGIPAHSFLVLAIQGPLREAQVCCLVGWGSSHGCPVGWCPWVLYPALTVHAPFRLPPWFLYLRELFGYPRVLWLKLTVFSPDPSRGSPGLASSERPVTLPSRSSQSGSLRPWWSSLSPAFCLLASQTP